jgi:hypothetical protein
MDADDTVIRYSKVLPFDEKQGHRPGNDARKFAFYGFHNVEARLQYHLMPWAKDEMYKPWTEAELGNKANACFRKDYLSAIMIYCRTSARTGGVLPRQQPHTMLQRHSLPGRPGSWGMHLARHVRPEDSQHLLMAVFDVHGNRKDAKKGSPMHVQRYAMMQQSKGPKSRDIDVKYRGITFPWVMNSSQPGSATQTSMDRRARSDKLNHEEKGEPNCILSGTMNEDGHSGQSVRVERFRGLQIDINIFGSEKDRIEKTSDDLMGKELTFSYPWPDYHIAHLRESAKIETLLHAHNALNTRIHGNVKKALRQQIAATLDRMPCFDVQTVFCSEPTAEDSLPSKALTESRCASAINRWSVDLREKIDGAATVAATEFTSVASRVTVARVKRMFESDITHDKIIDFAEYRVHSQFNGKLALKKPRTFAMC